MDTLPADEKLQVGDVGVIVGATYHPENIGRECIVLATPGYVRSLQSGEYVIAYMVELDGSPLAVRPQHIKKKRPPREDLQLVRWSECPWQPELLHV